MYQISVISGQMGQIQIDDFKETFFMDFGFWGKAEYEAHWLTASRALADGLDVSFIQSMQAPESANFFRIWAAYPRANEVVFQEQILFLGDGRSFNIQEPHLNAHPYHSLSEDGDEISEWRTTI